MRRIHIWSVILVDLLVNFNTRIRLLRIGFRRLVFDLLLLLLLLHYLFLLMLKQEHVASLSLGSSTIIVGHFTSMRWVLWASNSHLG